MLRSSTFLKRTRRMNSLLELSNTGILELVCSRLLCFSFVIADWFSSVKFSCMVLTYRWPRNRFSKTQPTLWLLYLVPKGMLTKLQGYLVRAVTITSTATTTITCSAPACASAPVTASTQCCLYCFCSLTVSTYQCWYFILALVHVVYCVLQSNMCYSAPLFNLCDIYSH